MDIIAPQPVIEADRAAARQRANLYGPIHKALRACLTHTMLKVGSTDASDAQAVAAALAQTSDLLDLCSAHIDKENGYMHPAIERVCPSGAREIADDHVSHRADIHSLRCHIDAVHSAPEEYRQLAVNDLYRSLALFVALNLEHMHQEETELNAILWTHYSDEELMALHAALVASIEPREMMRVMRWMLPSLHHAERAEMLAGMQANAPAPAFAAVLDLARQVLGGPDWAALCRVLKVAPEPGLVQTC
jgi:hemerythrin-like domain-containing protein